MKFSEQTVFVYDPILFTRADTKTALKIYREYTHRMCANPHPQFFEEDRAPGQYDSL